MVTNLRAIQEPLRTQLADRLALLAALVRNGEPAIWAEEHQGTSAQPTLAITVEVGARGLCGLCDEAAAEA